MKTLFYTMLGLTVFFAGMILVLTEFGTNPDTLEAATGMGITSLIATVGLGMLMFFDGKF